MLEISYLPFITLLIVVRNERSYIQKSLNSLLNQTYPKELIEIIIVDGMSSDGTRELVKKVIEELRRTGISISMINNPQYILASGWNIGIKNAKGEIVCRIDTHSEIYPDYVEIGVRELLKRKEEKVVCVGGVLENVGDGKIGESIADLFSSKFGVGNSAFRTGVKEPKYTDTAVFGLYWKWIFDEIGYFNEALKRNQDIDLHDRILKLGYKFLTHPDMKIKYYVRNNISGLIKKAFGDGYWVVASSRSYLRHKVPFYFVLYLLSLLFIILITNSTNLLWIRYIYMMPLIIYTLFLFFFSIKDGKSLIRKLLLLFLFPIFHISYGLGSFKALLDRYILERVKE
uniref:Glycosyltransferase family 2 protein n=1 Tax=Dictyoglomus thermophilum TaxID=14 RepID=A0A7C3RK94_DICTH